MHPPIRAHKIPAPLPDAKTVSVVLEVRGRCDFDVLGATRGVVDKELDSSAVGCFFRRFSQFHFDTDEDIRLTESHARRARCLRHHIELRGKVSKVSRPSTIQAATVCSALRDESAFALAKIHRRQRPEHQTMRMKLRRLLQSSPRLYALKSSRQPSALFFRLQRRIERVHEVQRE